MRTDVADVGDVFYSGVGRFDVGDAARLRGGKLGAERNGVGGGEKIVGLRLGIAEERHIVDCGYEEGLVYEVGEIGEHGCGEEVQVALAERGLAEERVAVVETDDLMGDGA